MSLQISIIIPAIRTHLWKNLVESIDYSCRTPYEIIFASPFDLPESVAIWPQVRHIKTYDTVSVAIQKATLIADGDIIMHAVDDSIFIPGRIDDAIKFFEQNCNLHDAVGLTYIENTNNMTPAEKWAVKNCPEFHLPYIDRNWTVFVQPMMLRDWFIELGGFDCRFFYSNHAHIDLSLRLQQAGGKVFIPPFTVSHASHMPERSGDHGPIHDTQTQIDEPEFNKLWSSPRQTFLFYDNYKKYEGQWQARFNKQYNSYSELCEGEGYSV